MKKFLCIYCLTPMVALAQMEADVPWGIEAVTGYRSELVHRGFKLADDVYDYQLETEIALSDEWSLNVSAFYATGTGKGNDYAETTGIVDLRYDAPEWSAGWMLGFRDFTATFFRDGWETGPFLTYRFSDDLEARMEYLYDQGGESFYGAAQLVWSRSLSEKSFVSLRGGVSHVEDYYDSKGFHAMDFRASYTYLFTSNVSLTPFIGSSVALDPRADDALLGGAWFEVTF
ncbi:MAG: hypothetical protein RLZZ553_522 [Verrucomicrobiota bacterium]